MQLDFDNPAEATDLSNQQVDNRLRFKLDKDSFWVDANGQLQEDLGSFSMETSWTEWDEDEETGPIYSSAIRWDFNRD